ncbi:ATP-dependent DNA helicase [Elysia marginata]|uniref:ATP-dependent DNA helicase n=1 Tax=Elysia marginata TaxID=1093978 RepID=A0AAV4F5R0_9GAST|nr:ATP-dependent DNA helicase [Elysia marginata]
MDLYFQFDNADDQSMRKINNIMNPYSMKQFIDKPTHEKSHILDRRVWDEHQALLNLEVENNCISYHHVGHIIFELDKKKPGPLKRKITSRRNDIEHEQFKMLAGAVSSVKVNETNVVEAYNNNMTQIMDKHAPVITKTVTDRPSAHGRQKLSKRTKKNVVEQRSNTN